MFRTRLTTAAFVAASAFLTAPASAQLVFQEYDLSLSAFDFLADFRVQCQVVGSTCYGSGIESGTGEDGFYGLDVGSLVFNLNQDHGVTNILAPDGQTNISFDIDNGGDGQEYSFDHVWETDQLGNQVWKGQLTSYNADGSTSVRDANLNLTLVNPPAAAVPEVATWGMMVVGFGLAGAAMRYRRSSVRFA